MDRSQCGESVSSDGLDDTCTFQIWNVTITPDNMRGYHDETLLQQQQFESIVRIVIPVVFGLITLLGLFGNSMVLFVVSTNNKMRTTTDMLILILAIADLLFIIICVPFTAAAYVSPRWIFGTAWCKISQYFIYVSACVSIYSLVLMSLTRFLAVVYPLSSKPFVAKRNTVVAIVVMWVVIVSGYSPLLSQYDVISYSFYGEERSACINMKTMNDRNSQKIFTGTFFVFGYAIPLGVLIILYSIMVVVLRGRSTHVRTASKERDRAHGRATIMIMVIVLAFLVCWLPLQIILMIQAFGHYPYSNTAVAWQMAANCLAYFNSCVNPLLYTFLSSKYRASFKRVLCCGARGQCRTVHLVQSTSGPGNSSTLSATRTPTKITRD